MKGPVLVAAILAFCFLALPCRGAEGYASRASSPIPYDGSSSQYGKPYDQVWGKYRVVIDTAGNHGRVLIFSRSGRLVREVRAEDIETVDYPVLRNGHTPALRVLVGHVGVAESCERTYLFDQEHGLRNILALTGEITRIDPPKGYDMALLFANSSVPLQYFTEFSHSACGNVALVLGWNGHRYVIKNRTYPHEARYEAKKERQQLLDAATEDWRDPNQVAAAIGCCANLWTLGEGLNYFHWLKGNLTPSGRHWFMSAQPELRSRMLSLKTMVSVDNRRVVVFRDDG